MKKAENIYHKKQRSRYVVEDWRADMENYTGFDVTMIFYDNGKIGVGVDRAGFFIFRSMDVLIDKASGPYIAEKLTIPESDGKCLVDFFNHVHESK